MNEVEALCHLVETKSEKQAALMLAQWPPHRTAYLLRAYSFMWTTSALSWLIRQPSLPKDIAPMVISLMNDWHQLDNFSLHLLDVMVPWEEAIDLAFKQACEPSLWNMVGFAAVYLEAQMIHRVLSQNSQRAWPFVKAFHLHLYAFEWDSSILKRAIVRADACLLASWCEEQSFLFRDKTAKSMLEAKRSIAYHLSRRMHLICLVESSADNDDQT